MKNAQYFAALLKDSAISQVEKSCPKKSSNNSTRWDESLKIMHYNLACAVAWQYLKMESLCFLALSHSLPMVTLYVLVMHISIWLWVNQTSLCWSTMINQN